MFCFLKGHWTSITAIFLHLVPYRGFKIKPIPKISANSANTFSFYQVFCEHHHLQNAPYVTVLCKFIEVDFEK